MLLAQTLIEPDGPDRTILTNEESRLSPGTCCFVLLSRYPNNTTRLPSSALVAANEGLRIYVEFSTDVRFKSFFLCCVHIIVSCAFAEPESILI